MKEAAPFEIIETPLGQFTLRHTRDDQTNDYGPFPSKDEAEKGMTRIILKPIWRYNAIGTLLEK